MGHGTALVESLVGSGWFLFNESPPISLIWGQPIQKKYWAGEKIRHSCYCAAWGKTYSLRRKTMPIGGSYLSCLGWILVPNYPQRRNKKYLYAATIATRNHNSTKQFIQGVEGPFRPCCKGLWLQHAAKAKELCLVPPNDPFLFGTFFIDYVAELVVTVYNRSCV